MPHAAIGLPSTKADEGDADPQLKEELANVVGQRPLQVALAGVVGEVEGRGP